ncbi:MAG TPA: hypothetical protein VK174_12340 [Chitinophagales bacterium]|nr:hypothetical protein [Chitinophagales bacterium]
MAALLFLSVSSCTKRSDENLNNIAAYRPDASQAQRIDYTSVSTPTTLTDRVNGVDYIISNTLYINQGRFTIEPGVTIMFEDGAGIVVNPGGALTAIGSGGKEIYFISKSGKRGAWNGITYLSDNAANVLSYCVIKEGGSTTSPYGRANVVVAKTNHPASVEISHSTITTSDNVGILVSEGSQLLNFNGNTITTNTSYPISVYVANTSFLNGSNTYTNNGKQFIELTGYENSPVEQTVTLKNIALPYALTGAITAGNAVKIEPGVRVYMNNGSQLTIDGINGSGTLTAVGTAAQPIILTGAFNTAGIWSSINFKGSTSSTNKLEYCTITSGGGNTQSNHGMINLMGTASAGSQVDIRNCTITNSASYGIYIQRNTTLFNADIETANTFANNAGANVYYDVNIASGE